jgi:hypothetical protein
MAQAMVDKRRNICTKDVGIQTGNDDEDIIYPLPNNKMIRLYYSPVYKERVVSFNISTSKSFIINKDIWNHIKKILPKIDHYLQ